jgi:hypothetical protein
MKISNRTTKKKNNKKVPMPMISKTRKEAFLTPETVSSVPADIRDAGNDVDIVFYQLLYSLN